MKSTPRSRHADADDYNRSATTTATLPRSARYRHWLYTWIPIFTAVIWFGTVLALLVTWLAQGRPIYVSMSPGQTIAYISDVAADILKPLFITGCAITSVGFFWSLVADKWLRHNGRLLANRRKSEKWMAGLAIFWSFIGGMGLILLSIFDTKRHDKLHRLFLLFFVAGVALSAIFTVIEFHLLRRSYVKEYSHLGVSLIAKSIFTTILVILAIIFGVFLLTGNRQNVAACIEWTIAFGYTFYLLTFWWDLRQSKLVQKGHYTGGVAKA